MPYDIVNTFNDGTYHLRDDATGEELSADEDLLSQLYAGGAVRMGQPSEPAIPPAQTAAPMAPMGPPAPPSPNFGLLSNVGAGLRSIGNSVGGAIYGAQPQSSPPEQAAPAQPTALRPIRGAQQGQPQATDPLANVPMRRIQGSPGGWHPESSTRAGIMPEDREALVKTGQQLYQAQADAATSRFEKQAAFDKRESAIANAQAVINQRKADELEAPIRMAQRNIQTQGEALNQRREAIRNMQVDPQRVWKDRGAAGSVLSAIAIGAGQYAAMKRGGRNAAADMIENMIDRDIEAQRANIAKAGNELAEDTQLFHQTVSNSADAKLLEQKMYRNEAAQAIIRQALADKRLAYMQNDLQDTLNGLMQTNLERGEKWAQLTHQSETNRYTMPTASRIEPDFQLMEQRAKARKLADEASGTDRLAPVRSEGREIARVPREEAGQMNDEIRKLDEAISLQQKVIDLHANGNILNQDDRARMSYLGEKLVGAMKKPGENSDADAERLHGMSGAQFDKVGSYNETTAQENLRTLIDERNKLTKNIGAANIRQDRSITTTE